MKKSLYMLLCAAFLAACSSFSDSDFTFITDEGTGGKVPEVRHVVVANATPGGDVLISPSQADYAHGAKVTLTAQPQSGYEFGYWDDGCITPVRKLTVSQDYYLTATFLPVVAPYHVKLFGSMAGTVSKFPDLEEYAPGMEVTITATPVSGYKFEMWSDGNTEATRTIIVDHNIVLSASFMIDREPEEPVGLASITDIFLSDENLCTVQTGNVPSSNGLNSITDFVMNTTALSGGTLEVSYSTTIEDHYVIVALEGFANYLQVVPVADGDGHYHFILVLNQERIDMIVNIVVIIVSNTDNNPINASNQDLSIVEAGGGLLQISLSFDNEKDVDLHVVEPSGGHIYFGNRRSENGGYLDIDSNAGCSIDGINNENVFYSEDARIEIGEYKVYALMFRNCDPSIATNYSISVFFNGQLICTPLRSTFSIGYENEGSSIEGKEPVVTFSITEDMLREINALNHDVHFAPEKKHHSAIEKEELMY